VARLLSDEESDWINRFPGERRAMRNALNRINEVARYEGNEQADYGQRLQAAKAAILICQNEEVTAYDKQLVPLLDLQFDGAQAEHEARLTADKDPLFARKLKVVEDSNRQTEAMLRIHLR
jgi:hypothetical protein